MKTLTDINKSKIPLVRIDKRLNKFEGKSLSPDKDAKARETFNRLGLPQIKHNH